MTEAAGRYRREPVPVPPHVTAIVAEREWPGNVRELRNAADRFALGLGLQFDEGSEAGGSHRLADRVADYERGLIASALMVHRGNLKPVYESLGLSRKSLYEKMQKYGLDKRGYLEESDTQ